MAIPKREMKCCNCGNYAGKFHQHYNRDNGFGICLRCVTDEIKSKGWKPLSPVTESQGLTTLQ